MVQFIERGLSLTHDHRDLPDAASAMVAKAAVAVALWVFGLYSCRSRSSVTHLLRNSRCPPGQSCSGRVWLEGAQHAREAEPE